MPNHRMLAHPVSCRACQLPGYSSELEPISAEDRLTAESQKVAAVTGVRLEGDSIPELFNQLEEALHCSCSERLLEEPPA